MNQFHCRDWLTMQAFTSPYVCPYFTCSSPYCLAMRSSAVASSLTVNRSPTSPTSQPGGISSFTISSILSRSEEQTSKTARSEETSASKASSEGSLSQFSPTLRMFQWRDFIHIIDLWQPALLREQLVMPYKKKVMQFYQLFIMKKTKPGISSKENQREFAQFSHPNNSSDWRKNLIDSSTWWERRDITSPPRLIWLKHKLRFGSRTEE